MKCVHLIPTVLTNGQGHRRTERLGGAVWFCLMHLLIIQDIREDGHNVILSYTIIPGSVAAGSRTLPGNVFDDDIRPGPPLKFINISPLDLLVYILIYFAEGCFP